MKMVSGFGLRVPSWLLISGVTTLLVLAGCSKETTVEAGDTAATNTTARATAKVEPVIGNEDADLLMRVRFAGTTALMADTNAAYLTNIAALPETAALGQRIVERMASLPERLVRNSSQQRGASNEPATPSAAPSAKAVERMFADLLRDGFVLELRGDSNGVSSMALAAKGRPEKTKQWSEALARVVQDWSGTKSNVVATGESWSSSDGTIRFASSNGWATWVVGQPPSTPPASPSVFRPSLLTGSNILEVQMASSLLPGPIRRSVYGGFEQVSFSVTPDNQSLRIRGKATYPHDLPELGKPRMVPDDLVRERAISFSMVRHPEAWLEPGSALLGFLPKPLPEVAYFWGGESSPQQWFMAVPYQGTNFFDGEFAPVLFQRLEHLAFAIDYGPVVLDREQERIQWQGLPFFGPQVTLKESGSAHFLVAEMFPSPDFPPGLSPALIGSINGRTNLVAFDWEFVLARLQTWFRLGQLAIMLSGNNQLDAKTASARWVDAAPKTLLDGGNTTSEITQTGPRELTLARRGPVAFTSLELFWLANWLESPNFPAANFLVPVPKAEAGGQ